MNIESRDFSGIARQFSRFILVGVGNMAVSYSVYLLALLMLPYPIAFVIAFFVSLTVLCLFNVKYVFQGRLRPFTAVVYSLYYTAYLVVNLLLLRFLVERLGVSAVIGPIVLSIVMIPPNFLCTRWIARL